MKIDKKVFLKYCISTSAMASGQLYIIKFEYQYQLTGSVFKTY